MDMDRSGTVDLDEFADAMMALEELSFGFTSVSSAKNICADMSAKIGPSVGVTLAQLDTHCRSPRQ